MDKGSNAELERKLDTIIGLLQYMLALQLAGRGVNQTDIGKHIHVATATVGKMLKGVRDDG
jgi:predicted transcriptional regulator